MRHRLLAISVVLALAIIPARIAGAVVSGTADAATKINPPAFVNQSDSGLGSNTTMWAWDEQQGVTLASNVSVDITTTGSYESAASRTIGTIPAGTVVDSHFFHSDRINNGNTPITLTGTLTFPTDILGIAVTRGRLNNTNVLGAPGTDYTVAQLNNDLELSTTGDGVFVPNLRTVTLRANTSNDLDEIRIITRHDGPPIANAGGPYAANEGGSVTLNGTASDPEGDAFTTSWSFATSSAKPGTICTPSNTTTLTPTITCNDDAVVTATLSIADPFHAATTSTAQVTFGNVAPALGALTVPSGQIPLSTSVGVSANFSDAGSHDTHAAVVDWGDTTSSAATITETNGSGSLARTHTYAAGGHYTITVTLTDDDGGTAIQTATVDVNGPPTASAGGPYAGNEGTATALAGTASDPESDPIATTWSITPSLQDAGTVCSTTNTSTLAPTVNCNDDAVLNAQLSADDGINAPTVANTTITINNVAPVMGPVTATAGPVPVGGTVNITAPFLDSGTNDTHTATVSWGDVSTTNASILEANGSGGLSASHAYTTAGLYTATITLHDDNGGTDVKTVQVLVNTPPTVDAGGPYAGTEGSQMLLSASANDVDGDALTYSWTFSWTGASGTTCNATGAGTHAPTLTLVCNDDAVVDTHVTVSDGVNAPVSDSASLTVGNVSPVAGTVVQSASAPSGSTVAITLPFSDAGTHDTHTATVDWGDSSTSPASVSESAGAGSVSASHLYTSDGDYTVTVTITDDDGDSGAASGTVVSDTTAPTISHTIAPAPNGAGWNNSPTTVTWNVTDSLSDATQSGCDPVTRSADTSVSGVTYTCDATSRGGHASQSAVVKLDQVAPTLTGAATAPPNGNGWYNGPVTIQWTCSDALSGIAGSCPSNSTLSSEGAAVSASAAVSDVADNTTNASSAPVKIDTHAPTTSASTLPEWNNNSVTVSLSATDNLSGVDTTKYVVDGGPTQTGTSVLLTDEGVHHITFWSIDQAGNVETAHSATVKIDRTAPSIAVDQSPVANGAGWNSSDATVTFTCDDALSGVASCTSPQTISAEGAGQIVTGTATDDAGNSASASRTLNIDKTAPTLDGVLPAPNANGWYNGPVSLTWACTDGLSGVASCPAGETFSLDGANQFAVGTATDIADNSKTKTVSGVNVDQTAPTITAAVVPSPNLAGWSNSSVVVHFSCADATSGIAAGACPADQSVSTEGLSTVAGSVVDRAGNSASTSVTVKIDTVAPGITGAQTPAPNGAGWNNTDVTVSFACTDAGSGIAVAGCTAPVVVAEGGNQSVTGTAVDDAGNVSSATVAPVNVDKTAPTLVGTPTTAPNADGWYNGPVTIHWQCSDALSGVLGACPSDSVISGEGTGLTVSASVSDVAGNTATASSTAVKIDKTAPSTSASSAPNWSNSSVTISLSSTDSLSGVAATHYTLDGGATQNGSSVVLSTEGVHTIQYWSVDKAGNTEDAHTATVKIDLSAPSISVSQSPDPNANGWNNTDVTVTFTCGDAVSGLATCSSPVTLTSEGAAQTVSGSATDNAGNTATASRTLNIDKTAPSITGIVPAANANGWYSAPVTVAWSCADALSGVAACAAPQTLSTDGSAQSAAGTASDTAGNSRTATASGINIDQTPPELTVSVPPTSTGWYPGPVTVHWICNDNLSGVTSCPADTVVSDEGFTTVAETVTDQAGNSTTNDVTIRIDKTPPVIVGTATPGPNANGWNNTDVAVSFACTDALSGVATCSAPTTLHEGANQSVTGHSTDLVGNTASATVSGISVDTTAPTLSGAPTTSPNGAGWYDSAVVIQWTCGDALSGVASCPTPSSLTTEGAAQQLSRTAFDLAGNAKTAASPPVKIDLTEPVTTASAVPTSFTNTDVSVSLSATDNLSGVAQTYYAVDGGPQVAGSNVTFSTTGVHTLTYHSVDVAGNIESTHTVTVRIDKDAPTIDSAQAPAANGAGWNNTNVTVTFTCADALSGIASCTAPQAVTTEGAFQAVSGTAIDNAGNSASTARSVSVDKTAPTITGTLSAVSNANGWFRVPVSASFACNDTLSGLASCSGPVAFGEGAAQSVTRTATDVAGNVGGTTVGPVNVDLTAPTIVATPDRAPDSGGTYNGPVTIHFTCTDALSGIAPGDCPADVVVATDGTTTVTGSTTDRAGNVSTTSAAITLTVQSIRTQKQNVLIQISAAQNSGTKHDANMLKVARDALAASIDPSLWAVGNHLQVHGGVKVFEKEKQAVDKLQQIRSDSGTAISSATLTGWINTLTNADRVLATTQLNDAVSANGNPQFIQASQAAIAAGDLKVAAGDSTGAINDYKNAWMAAEQSVGKNPD